VFAWWSADAINDKVTVDKTTGEITVDVGVISPTKFRVEIRVTANAPTSSDISYSTNDGDAVLTYDNWQDVPSTQGSKTPQISPADTTVHVQFVLTNAAGELVNSAGAPIADIRDAVLIETPDLYYLSATGVISTTPSKPDPGFINVKTNSIPDELTDTASKSYIRAARNEFWLSNNNIVVMDTVAPDINVVDRTQTIYLGYYLNAYHVVYDVNGGVGPGLVDDTDYSYNDTVTVNYGASEIAKPGYTVEGWFYGLDDITGDEIILQQNDTFIITANTTLYAVWERDPNWPDWLHVTYDANGASGGDVPVDDGLYADGESVNVLGNEGGLYKGGHSWEGYALTANATTGIPNFTITGNTTLYAVWELLPDAPYWKHVVYRANVKTSGDVPVDSGLYEAGDTVTVRGNTGVQTIDGYIFGGWTD
jgi:hypothetical protein